MKPPDPETLALLHKHPLYKGALSVVKKKVKKLFRELKSGRKDKRRVKKTIRNTLNVADMILSSDYYKGLYEQEWDLYNGVSWGMRKKFEDVQSLIEILLANDDCRIAYPRTVRRFCDKYLKELKNHYT
jgi:hypothetical protein